MAAYAVEPWSDLFVAAAGAGAALAGLVFVAVSINIERILALKGLAERGLETVVTLLVVVIIALAGLIPGQSTVALGVELLLIAVAYLGLIIKLWPSVRPSVEAPWTWTFGRIFVKVILVVPLVVGSIGLIAEGGGGLYWIVGAIVGGITGAVATAWVLLVEILR